MWCFLYVMIYVISKVFHWLIITWEMQSHSTRSLRIRLYLKTICKLRLPWKWELVNVFWAYSVHDKRDYSILWYWLSKSCRLPCTVKCPVDLKINFMLLLINQGNIPQWALTCTTCSSRGSGNNMWMHQQLRITMPAVACPSGILLALLCFWIFDFLKLLH